MGTCKLTELCRIQYGYAFDSASFTEDASFPPLVRIRDVKRGFSETYYSGNYSEEYIVRRGDILIGMDGEFNIARWQSEPALLNQRVCKIIPNQQIDGSYLLFALTKILKKIEDKTAFVTVKHLSAKELNKIELRIPNYEQQMQISSTLEKALSIISRRQYQLAKLDELVKCRFVELFSHTQCPHMEIQNIAEDVFAGGDKPKDIVETRDTLHPYPVYANGEVKRGLQGYSQLCRVDKKAITVSARGTIGYCCIRDAGFTPIVRLITLIPKKHINLTYISEAIKFIGVGASGAVQAQLTVPDFKKIKIPLPSTNEQNAFADFVHRIDKLRVAVQASLDKTQQLFDSLMQEYFG